jgi:purine-binding chemotaxis protein CheW
MSEQMSKVQDNAKGAASTFQIVVFRLGHEEYALQIGQIKEVVQTPSITSMPQSPEYIKGVSNIRGNVIAIVDLEERFGLKSKDADNVSGKYTLVVESEEFKMGVLVKDVPNTMAIAESAVDQSLMSNDDQSYIKGIVKLDKRLIILIDIFKVMTTKDLNQSFNRVAAA